MLGEERMGTPVLNSTFRSLTLTALLLVMTGCGGGSSGSDSASSTTPSDSSRPQLDSATAATLQQVLDQTTASTGIAGAVLLVRHKDGSQWVGASGVAEAATLPSMSALHWQGTPMDSQMLFRIASVTKTFTGTLIMQLVDDGIVGLDDVLDQWLPGIVAYSSQITIRELFWASFSY